jgi:hypothetical protein
MYEDPFRFSGIRVPEPDYIVPTGAEKERSVRRYRD